MLYSRLSALIFGLHILYTASLLAESVAGVEYSLAGDVRKWKAGPRFSTSDGYTLVYLLEGQRRDEWDSASEIFTIQVTCQRQDVPMLIQQEGIYGFGPLEYRTLEENSQGTLVEWWTTEGPPTMHAWMRCLRSDKGTVCLQYMTIDPEKVLWAKQIWEPILRAAKYVATSS